MPKVKKISRNQVLTVAGTLMVALIGFYENSRLTVEAEMRDDIKDLIDRVARIETAQTALNEDLRETKENLRDTTSRLDRVAIDVTRLKASVHQH